MPLFAASNLELACNYTRFVSADDCRGGLTAVEIGYREGLIQLNRADRPDGRDLLQTVKAMLLQSIVKPVGTVPTTDFLAPSS